MAVGDKAFEVEIVTPSESLERLACTYAAIPAWDGEIGLLSGRAPLVCKLGAGELRLEVNGAIRRYYVQGGFAEMLDDVLTVLTDQIVPAGELSPEQAEQELAEALAVQAGGKTSQNKSERVEQARARARIARKR